MCKYRQAKLRCLLLALWRLRRSWRGSGLCEFPNFSETTQILEFDLFSSFSGMDILFYGSSIQLPLFCKVLKDWYFVVCFPDFCIFFPLIAVFFYLFCSFVSPFLPSWLRDVVLCSKVSTLALGLNQPPVQWVTRTLLSSQFFWDIALYHQVMVARSFRDCIVVPCAWVKSPMKKNLQGLFTGG